MSGSREQIESAVEAFLARGGKITTPEPRQLRLVKAPRPSGKVGRVWAKAPPAMGEIGSKAGKRKPPRVFK